MGNDWVKELVPGDRVIVSYMHREEIKKVERLTKTQVVLVGGSKFNRSHGGAVGESYTHLYQYTADRAMEILRQSRARRIHSRTSLNLLKKCTLSELNQILDILEEADAR